MNLLGTYLMMVLLSIQALAAGLGIGIVVGEAVFNKMRR